MFHYVSRARLLLLADFVSLYLRNLKKLRTERFRYSMGKFFPRYVSLGVLTFFQTGNLHDNAQKVNDTSNSTKEAEYVSVCIVQSDEYFKVGKFEESYNVLQNHEVSNNVEVLWRIARSLYKMSQECEVKSLETEMIEHAYSVISRALMLDSNNYAVHKWMAILLDTKSSLEGVKARIKALPEFKKHLLRAMELNPKDATSIYILGQYCYNLASMPWYQRKIASAIFSTPPESTFEEALFYFDKAEKVEPNFYRFEKVYRRLGSRLIVSGINWAVDDNRTLGKTEVRVKPSTLNLLMLGKTYLQLNKIEAARYWLKCASTYPIRTEEDRQVRKEAEELLRKHASAE